MQWKGKTSRHIYIQTVSFSVFFSFYLPITPHSFFQHTMDQKYFCKQAQHLYIYSGLTCAKGSPSYTLLVMDTYCRVSGCHCPRCSQQTYTPYLLTAVKRRRGRRKENLCVYINAHMLSLLLIRTQKGQEQNSNQDYFCKRCVHLRTTLFLLLQQQ